MSDAQQQQEWEDRFWTVLDEHDSVLKSSKLIALEPTLYDEQALVAKKDIPRGALLFSDTPVLRTATDCRWLCESPRLLAELLSRSPRDVVTIDHEGRQEWLEDIRAMIIDHSKDQNLFPRLDEALGKVVDLLMHNAISSLALTSSMTTPGAGGVLFHAQDNTALSLYPVVASISHSCQPNTVLLPLEVNHRVEVRAVRDIAKDEEITIAHMDISHKHRAVRLALIDRWKGEECGCSFCHYQAPDTLHATKRDLNRRAIKSLKDLLLPCIKGLQGQDPRTFALVNKDWIRAQLGNDPSEPPVVDRAGQTFCLTINALDGPPHLLIAPVSLNIRFSEAGKLDLEGLARRLAWAIIQIAGDEGVVDRIVLVAWTTLASMTVTHMRSGRGRLLSSWYFLRKAYEFFLRQCGWGHPWIATAEYYLQQAQRAATGVGIDLDHAKDIPAEEVFCREDAGGVAWYLPMRVVAYADIDTARVIR